MSEIALRTLSIENIDFSEEVFNLADYEEAKRVSADDGLKLFNIQFGEECRS